jgi:hypothetical protein
VGSTYSNALNAPLQNDYSGLGAGMVAPTARGVTSDFKSLLIYTNTPSFRLISFLIPYGIDRIASAFCIAA